MATKYIICIAEKYTKEPLTPMQEVEADHPYDLARMAEKIWNIKVDGSTNYVDYCEAE
jgi:hypothetical protein